MGAIALGNSDDDRVLVTVFLRGGADGLALVPPVGDDGYHRARPRLGVSSSGALRLDGPFGLAPELAALHPWFLSGRLAVVHAVGLGEDTRSHFVAQELMERGGPAAAGGWLGRWLRARGVGGALTAVSTGSEVPDSLRGAPGATALGGLLDLASGEDWTASLRLGGRPLHPGRRARRGRPRRARRCGATGDPPQPRRAARARRPVSLADRRVAGPRLRPAPGAGGGPHPRTGGAGGGVRGPRGMGQPLRAGDHRGAADACAGLGPLRLRDRFSVRPCHGSAWW